MNEYTGVNKKYIFLFLSLVNFTNIYNSPHALSISTFCTLAFAHPAAHTTHITAPVDLAPPVCLAALFPFVHLSMVIIAGDSLFCLFFSSHQQGVQIPFQNLTDDRSVWHNARLPIDPCHPVDPLRFRAPAHLHGFVQIHQPLVRDGRGAHVDADVDAGWALHAGHLPTPQMFHDVGHFVNVKHVRRKSNHGQMRGAHELQPGEQRKGGWWVVGSGW